MGIKYHKLVPTYDNKKEFSENFIPWLKTNWAFLTLVPFAVILWFSLLAPITAMFTMSEKPDIYNIIFACSRLTIKRDDT